MMSEPQIILMLMMPRMSATIIIIRGIRVICGSDRLIDHSLPLEPDEEKAFRKIIQENPIFQEAKMLQSIEEVGIEKGLEQGIDIGMEQGIDIGMENAAIKLLRAQVLTKEQIADIIGIDMEKMETLEKKLNAESA